MRDEDPNLLGEWLERRVEQRLERAREARLQAYRSGDLDAASCEVEVVRNDLREHLRAQVTRERPAAVEFEIETFYELRDRKLNLQDDEDPSYEADRREAIERWNQAWRPPASDEMSLPPSLTGVNLAHCDLPGIDLTNADLRPLSGAYSGRHYDANLRGAVLRGANLVHNELQRTSLEESDLRRATLVGAHLDGANLRGANLEGADLRGANLEKADLTHANLRGADLRGTEMHLATLDGADLSFAKGLLLDENSVFRTRFTNRAGVVWTLFLAATRAAQGIGGRFGLIRPEERIGRLEREDSWSMLRRTYTGPNFFITLLFLLAFLLPHMGKAFVLSTVSRVEESLLERASSVLGEDFAGSLLTPEELAAVEARLQERRFAVWQILLGLDTGQYGWSILIGLLFVFNGLRWLLTITIAPMRDAEERSHITPAALEYRVFLPLHRVVSVLYWVALGVGTYTFTQWMASPVYRFW